MRTLLCALAAVALAACSGNTDPPLPEEPLLAPDLGMLTFGGTFGNAVYVEHTPQQTLQLRNGGRQKLVVDSVTIEGDDAELFTAVPSGQTAESGELIYVLVTYKPPTAGSHNAILVIRSNTSSYEIQRENPDPNDPMRTLPPLQIGPTTRMEISTFAKWRFNSSGVVTDTASPPKPLKDMKVTCVKPKGASCTGDSECLASGLSCVELTCQDPRWRGFERTTDADGKYSADHSWECGEILVQDPSATPAYASNVAPFTGSGVEAAVKLDAVYAVHGKVVEKGTTTGLANMKVSCMAPLSPPLSWTGWNVQSGGDGTFASTHVWPCKELYAEDAQNHYLPAAAVWSTADAGVTIEMEKRP